MEEDQYGMPDLRHYIAARPNFFPPPPELLPTHRTPPNPYDLLMFRSNSDSANIIGGDGGGGGAGRWPRQETLTLLEIRSRLDPKFKEANQKGPLWDEVSRIMSEEHGYQRSGKKCREKFENLYKYYKKTKEGKAGRQDGKHYRFFRQLEALYGDNTTITAPNTNNNNNNNNNNYSLVSASASELPYHIPHPPPPHISNFPDNTNSLSLSNYDSSEQDTTSSSDEPKSKKRDEGWKVRVKEFVDLQMKRLMEKQEAWMEKMVAAVEHKERERASREEEWRKKDAERVDREQRFWAGERAWIEARDVALMEALRKITGKELVNNNNNNVDHRNKAEGLSTTGSVSSWEDVGNNMTWLGNDRIKECVDNNIVNECNKKRKENSKGCGFFDGDDNEQQQGFVEPSIMRLSDDNIQSSNNNNNNNNNISESCLRYLMGDAYGRII